MDPNNNFTYDIEKPTLSTKMHLKVKCELCQKHFFRELMKKHMQVSHPDVKIFGKNTKVKCKVCNKPFSSKGNLIRHKKEVHMKKVFNCEICNKHFKVESNLSKHIKSLHDGVTLYALAFL